MLAACSTPAPGHRSPNHHDAASSTERSFFDESAAAGWDAYVGKAHEQVTRAKLDEFKGAYRSASNRRQIGLPRFQRCAAH